MMGLPPKPLSLPKPQRLPERKRVTLIAGFRCRDNGILLCADREENDGISRRAVDKIYRVRRNQADIWIAGAGSSSNIIKFNMAVENVIKEGEDWLPNHIHLLESALTDTYKSYKLKHYELGCIVVLSSHMTPYVAPAMYRTEGAKLLPEYTYTSNGSGKTICDYLADRLYEYGRLDNVALFSLALFILRETEESTSGVGLGADMFCIDDNGRHEFRAFGPDKIKEIQACLPSLSDSLWPHWTHNVKVPDWLAQ